MAMILSRALVFFLLMVDWVEDPQFGTYIFSTPMSSSLVSPLDTGFRQERNQDASRRNNSDKLTIDEIDQFTGSFFHGLPVEKPLTIEPSSETLYVFMSLQR